MVLVNRLKYSAQVNPLSAMMRIKAVLVDLSGTLHVGDDPVPGALDALAKLKSQDSLKIRYVTNTTKESKRVLLERLNKIGFTVQRHEIFSSLSAARRIIDERKLRPFLMIDKAAMEDFQGVPQDNPNAVVVGLAPDEMNYNNLNIAMRLIFQGSPLIAIHKSRYYRCSDGLSLGPGPFVEALEYATDMKSEVVGKPSAEFFKSSITDLGCDPSECIMIGDDARDDIHGAQLVDMKGILVQTGKYREGDEKMIQPPPFKVVPSFAQAVEEVLHLCE